MSHDSCSRNSRFASSSPRRRAVANFVGNPAALVEQLQPEDCGLTIDVAVAPLSRMRRAERDKPSRAARHVRDQHPRRALGKVFGHFGTHYEIVNWNRDAVREVVNHDTVTNDRVHVLDGLQ